MRWRRADGRTETLRSLTTLLMLGLSFVSLEIHDASHRLQTSYADLAVQVADPHPPLPAHFGPAIGFYDLDCPDCAASLQHRGPAADRAGAAPCAATSDALPAGDLSHPSSLLERLPVSRGPPLS